VIFVLGQGGFHKKGADFVFPNGSHTLSMDYEKGYEDIWKSFTAAVSGTQWFTVALRYPSIVLLLWSLFSSLKLGVYLATISLGR
jgi:hypothetical protein